MAKLTLRSVKGSPLTNTELDGNFEYFTGSHAITGSLIVTGGITGVENSISSSYISGSNVITTSGSIQYLQVTSKFISEGTAFIYTASLPATDPTTNGQLWRSGSYLMISTGSGS